MSEDNDTFFITAFFVALLAFGIFVGWTISWSTERGPREIICTDYLGGSWHDDVCLKDGHVVSTRPRTR